MTQFHEGQDVEVLMAPKKHGFACEAKIVEIAPVGHPAYWLVQFPDGTRAVFDAEHIRAAEEEDTA
jgi:hypothetical protein